MDNTKERGMDRDQHIARIEEANELSHVVSERIDRLGFFDGIEALEADGIEVIWVSDFSATIAREGREYHVNPNDFTAQGYVRVTPAEWNL